MGGARERSFDGYGARTDSVVIKKPAKEPTNRPYNMPDPD